MDALWSALEPTLSIVNACLPILQPVFMVVSTKLKSTFSSSRTKSATDERSWNITPQEQDRKFPGNSRTKFERIYDHLYPLSQKTSDSMYAVGTENEIEGRGLREGSDIELAELEELQDMHVKQTSIAVKKEWKVSSPPARK